MGTGIQSAGIASLLLQNANFAGSITFKAANAAIVPPTPMAIATTVSSAVRHSGRRRVLGLNVRMV